MRRRCLTLHPFLKPFFLFVSKVFDFQFYKQNHSCQIFSETLGWATNNILKKVSSFSMYELSLTQIMIYQLLKKKLSNVISHNRVVNVPVAQSLLAFGSISDSIH